MPVPALLPCTAVQRFARLRLVLSAGAVLGLGAVSTSAAFLDDAATTAAFTSGGVSMAVSGEPGTASASTSSGRSGMFVAAPDAADALVPGGAGVLTRLVVHNTGSLPVQVSALTIMVLAEPTAGGTAAPLPTLTSLLHLTSAVLAEGDSAADADARCAEMTTGPGGPAAFTAGGVNPHAGAIAPGAAAQLCLRVFVPAGVETPDVVDVEDAATLSIRFDAVQVAAGADGDTMAGS